MRLIAFVTEGTQIEKILEHIGVDSQPRRIAPPRGPPLWDDCGDAQIGAGVAVGLDWALAAQPVPDDEVDQRISWRLVEAATLTRCGASLRLAHSSHRLSPFWTVLFHGGPATRAGNPGFARGSKPVPGRDTAARSVERPYPLSVFNHRIHPPCRAGRNHDAADALDAGRGLFSTWGISPALIQFALTESALMADPAGALETLVRLKQLDVELFIDDYGTGYSSLSYLQHLPVDGVKIEQSFVKPMMDSGDSTVIVCSTIELGHSLGLKVVAEGVESQAIWERLTGLSCDVAQDHLISMPMPAAQIQAWETQWARV